MANETNKNKLTEDQLKLVQGAGGISTGEYNPRPPRDGPVCGTGDVATMSMVRSSLHCKDSPGQNEDYAFYTEKKSP